VGHGSASCLRAEQQKDQVGSALSSWDKLQFDVFQSYYRKKSSQVLDVSHSHGRNYQHFMAQYGAARALHCQTVAEKESGK
jgi:hypothetical protein